MKISMGTLSYPNTRLSIIFALCVQSVAEICTFLNFEFEQINVIWNMASNTSTKLNEYAT